MLQFEETESLHQRATGKTRETSNRLFLKLRYPRHLSHLSYFLKKKLFVIKHVEKRGKGLTITITEVYLSPLASKNKQKTKSRI